MTTPAAPPRRGLPTGLATLALVLGAQVAGLSVATLAGQAPIEATPPPVAVAPPATDQPLSGVASAGGIIVRYRAGDDHHRLVGLGADGRTAWASVVPLGTAVACGPCPAALLTSSSAPPRTLDAAGAARSLPEALAAGRPVEQVGLRSTVLLDRRPDGEVAVVLPTGDGDVVRAVVATVGRPLTEGRVVAEADPTGASATLVAPLADPLRLAEAEVIHVGPTGRTSEVVAVPGPGSRVVPCRTSEPSDAATFLVSQSDAGGTAPATRLVDRRPQRPVDVVVPGFFDECTSTPDGWSLHLLTSGPSDDGSHTWSTLEVVDLDTLGTTRVGAVHRLESAQTPTLAVDPTGRWLALTRPDGEGLLIDGDLARPLGPAAWAGFDVGGGLWRLLPDGTTTREVPA